MAVRGVFFKRFAALFRQPAFYVITVIGNALVALAAYLLFVLERSHNPEVESFIDALWWAVATVTTVGYGDVTPETTEGKVLGICLMLFGTGLFATYTALFAGAMLSADSKALSMRARSLEREEKELEEVLARLAQLLKKK